MRFVAKLRVALIALFAVIGVSTMAHADGGRVVISVVKGGWVIGGSGGRGVLTFHGRRYPFSVGGVAWGLVFGASKSDLVGTVRNIRRPQDITGVYGAASAGAAIGVGPGVILLQNANGAILELHGRQVGLIANLDLNGLAITMP